jgi:hypothetical protein
MEVFRNNSGGWGPPELFQRLPVIFIGYTYSKIKKGRTIRPPLFCFKCIPVSASEAKLKFQDQVLRYPDKMVHQ